MFEQALAASARSATIRELRGLWTMLITFFMTRAIWRARRKYGESALKHNELGDRAGATDELVNLALVASNQGNFG